MLEIIDSGMVITHGGIISTFVIALLVIVGFYLLRSFGLYTMAKNARIEKSYLSFIPFVWIYIALRLAGRISFFGARSKNTVLVFTILFCIVSVIELVYYFLVYFPLVGYLLEGGEAQYYLSTYSNNPYLGIPYSLDGAFSTTQEIGISYVYSQGFINFISAIQYFSIIISLIILIIEVQAYAGIFRRYSPRHVFLFLMLSIFLDAFPIIVFALRKRRPVEIRRINIVYDPNDPNSPFNQNNQNGNNRNADDDPFSEFSDGGNKGKNNNGKGNDDSNPFEGF